MPLVLNLKQGDLFNVAYRRFVVSKVIDDDSCQIDELGGGVITVNRFSPTAAGSEVSFQISEASQGASPRIMISAPEDHCIWRQGGTSKSDVSLLAPVPEEHLISGLKNCAEVGRVALGSRAWEAFAELDRRRQHMPCDVYIYPSHTTRFGAPKVRWLATYVQHVESIGGRHPDRMKYRPESTSVYNSDNKGHWAIFWEVTDLRQLESGEALPMTRFQGVDKKKKYLSTFVPEGPLLVEPIET